MPLATGAPEFVGHRRHVQSGDASNTHLNRVQVVPLTSNVGRVYPSEVLVTVDNRPSKAMADQLTTVSKQRLINAAGQLLPEDMRKVERAVRVQLDRLDAAG